MGFSITILAQKPRTKTLIIDSDLDMGQYDVNATDVKGDTAEFTEFIGGVGNFESGLISGGLDVSGIMHAESTLQVDGNVILEGSVNNVNIADDGEITTSKGVNGADFNGVILKKNYTIEDVAGVSGLWVAGSGSGVHLFALPVGCSASGTIYIRKTFNGKLRVLGNNIIHNAVLQEEITESSPDTYTAITVNNINSLIIDIYVYEGEGGMYWKLFQLT